jgi:hypothetical protein
VILASAQEEKLLVQSGGILPMSYADTRKRHLKVYQGMEKKGYKLEFTTVAPKGFMAYRFEYWVHPNPNKNPIIVKKLLTETLQVFITFT